MHYLEHSVEASFELEDGRILTLKKVFAENYEKKRGSATEEFTGHKISYYIDGVPSKEKEYLSNLTNLIGTSELIKMLLMPNYFAEELSWADRRQILLEMCDGIADEDVIAANAHLKDLQGYLLIAGTTEHYTVDQYKKVSTAAMKDINKELQSIPARIDEAQKAMPDIAGLNQADIDKDITLTTTAIAETEQLKRQIVSSDTAGEAKARQIADLLNDLAMARTEHVKTQAKQNGTAYKSINEIQAELADLKNQLYSLENYTIESKQKKLAEMTAKRQSLFKEYETISSTTWQHSETCPTCNQALPADAIAKSKEAFNLAKSNRLAEINTEGQTTCNKDMIAILERANKTKPTPSNSKTNT